MVILRHGGLPSTADTKQQLLLVIPEGQEEETITRLSRVGFDGTIGYLKGGLSAWKAAGKETDSITSISALEAKEKIESDAVSVFDVRKESEYLSEHVATAENTPLSELNKHLAEFPEKKRLFSALCRRLPICYCSFNIKKQGHS